MLEVELPSEDIKLNEVRLHQSEKWPHMFGIMKACFFPGLAQDVAQARSVSFLLGLRGVVAEGKAHVRRPLVSDLSGDFLRPPLVKGDGLLLVHGALSWHTCRK